MPGQGRLRFEPLAGLLRRARAGLAVIAVLLAALFSARAARSATAPTNLLEGRRASDVSGVANAKVVSDGVAAVEGEDWNSSLAALFTSDRAFVEYDLGESRAIAAAFLEGDGNDEYLVSVSEDHATFVPLWTAEKRDEFGLRDRWTADLAARGRWVRVGPGRGDGSFSVAEVQLFEERPPEVPSIERRSAESAPAYVRTTLLYLVSAFCVLLFGTRATTRREWLVVFGIVVVVALRFTFEAMRSAWPLGAREVSLVRAAAAAVALAAAVRRVAPGQRFPSHPWTVAAALLASAVMAFASFYNLGRPQFYDVGNARPQFVHVYDMRVYEPFAKYFGELQYDGLYLASVLAYAEEKHGGSLDPIAEQEMRGLRDHQVRRVKDCADDIRAVRGRFSDERWNELRADMRYFEDSMGPAFLASLVDHGANATPVWVFFARLFLAHAPASDALLTLSGLVDAGLLVLMALALWRSFGLLPALLAMTVFGATDVYMYFTNWTGATLRHDWLVLLGLGASALKRERWVAAGVCLGLAAMIRAFPIVALIGVALPAVWDFGERWRREGRLPRPRRFLSEHAAALQVLGGAVGCMLFMFVLTGLLYSFSSWVNWFHKVALLNSDVGVNEISLRALVAGTEAGRGKVLQARMPLYLAAKIASVVLIAWLVRRRPLDQAMLIGMPLVWITYNPSSYYSHFVFLFALLASVEDAPPRPSAAGPATRLVPLAVPFLQVAFPLLTLCIAGYWVSLEPDEERHFQDATLLVFVTLGWLYANLVRATLAAPGTARGATPA